MGALAERWGWPPSELDELTVFDIVWWAELAAEYAEKEREAIRRGGR